MKRSRLQETSMEVTVGAFMFMILLALGFFTIVLSRQNIFRPSYRMEVVFDNVKGLREGDNVFVRGVSVGKIRTLQIKPDGVHIGVNLEQPVELHEDYAIEILPSSVLGGRYLNIYEGSHGTPEIPKGAVVKGLTPVDLIDEATKTTQIIKQALVEYLRAPAMVAQHSGIALRAAEKFRMDNCVGSHIRLYETLVASNGS